jgi:hypothetical protein
MEEGREDELGGDEGWCSEGGVLRGAGENRPPRRRWEEDERRSVVKNLKREFKLRLCEELKRRRESVEWSRGGTSTRIAGGRSCRRLAGGSGRPKRGELEARFERCEEETQRSTKGVLVMH